MGSRGRVSYIYQRDLQLTEENIRHVLERHNSNSTLQNKTKFPENWSDKKIVEAIEETLNTPAVINRPELSSHRHQVEKTIDGITVRVSYYYENGKAIFQSAYPLPSEVK
jgi:hypothetical protein